jgi:hypothetical protein
MHDSEWVLVLGASQYGNRSSGSIQTGELLNHISESDDSVSTQVVTFTVESSI